MATRRPASSRSRTNPMPPPPAPRSRSVLAKPVSQTTPESSAVLGDSSTSNRQQKEDTGTNIQVVIRCRNRSQREIEENSPIIVTSSGAKSKDISIETSIPAPSIGVGVATQSPTRTYPFDLVFGPEADQGMIYHDVVSPMLEQVLQGYNCTLFAYGQTGTGKTYTMQGDLNPSPMGNPSANAGMIPRVLFRLFHQLESTGVDFSVKISFVELYNEELRDLLTNDLSAPNGSTQPMGFGSKDKGGDAGLKMFDDAGKRGGVFIQGLEEVAVKDSKHALALLVKGSERRQIASTNFNEHSSRSHSVFSITVHIKDVAFGEDLLKTGKLHLVDLAGSENIGRSGAENKRAREAGIINQSLLTLGRVINALVDRAQHVPYRESKLTRLLQDSLGGRTKTCIIATVSPARSNMEETLSTLDYALRAKSIRNKPELNQRLTRHALLKEYVAEIDRLKTDLLATREKNGSYFTPERCEEIENEREMRKTEVLEARKQVDIIESQLRGVREEFEQSIALLMKRDSELKDTKEHLEKTKQTLQQKEQHLQQTTLALKDEVVVRKAYQNSEKNLDVVATDLKTTLAQSTRHIDGLHAKLERKSTVLSSNTRLVNKHGKHLASSSKNISGSIDQYIQVASDLQGAIESQTDGFSATQAERISKVSAQMDDEFKALRQQFQSLDAGDEEESNLFDNLSNELESAQSTFQSELSAWGERVKETVKRTCGTASTAVAQQNADIRRAVDSLQTALDNIVCQAKGFLQEQRQLVVDIKEYSNRRAALEIARLKKQNQMLNEMVITERSRASAAKDDLVQRVTGLLDTFLQERDDSLKSSTQEMQQENNEFVNATTVETTNRGKTFDTAETRTHVFDGVLQQAVRENKRKREIVSKTVADTVHVVDNALGGLQSTIHENAEASSSSLQRSYQESYDMWNESIEEHSRIKRARLETASNIQAGIQSNKSYIQSTLVSTSRDIDSFAASISSSLSELQALTASYGDDTMRGLTSVHDTALALLDIGTREDPVTGATPQKRQWNYVDHWDLAKSREELVGTSQVKEVEEPESRQIRQSIQPPSSLRASDLENRAPPVELAQPAKLSMGSAPTNMPFPVKVEEKEARPEMLVESRRRNVSTRIRRQ